MSFERSQSQARPTVGEFYDRAAGEGARYAEAVNRLARAFIYDKVPVRELESRVGQLKHGKTGDKALAAFEAARGQLEAVLHFCRGVQLHERANLIHGGPWQANILKQPVTSQVRAVKPETLTREQIAQEFAAFDLRHDLVTSEEAALSAYRAFLASSEDPVIPLSQNIKIKRVDVQALMNDLEVRIAERVQDAEERRTRLLELNRQLLALIQEIPREEPGKRFELQEIYLLRRLIQTADTGHLVSVSHGTPRQDLNINEASVDLVITFAGQRIDLQIKTYMARVSSHTLQQQNQELAYRERTLTGTKTQLQVLRAEAVRDSFDTTVRQKEDAPTSLRDKKVVFAPLLEALSADQSANLTTLLGLTEERCEQERRDFEERERQLNENIARILERKRREEELQAAYVDPLQAAADAERSRLAKIAAEHERARLESEQKRQAAAAAKERYRLAKKAAEEEEARQAALEKEARRKPSGWTARPLETLCDAPSLRRWGFLPESAPITVEALRAAKEVFFQVFSKEVFFQLFPNKKVFENPSAEKRAEVQALRAAARSPQQK